MDIYDVLRKLVEARGMQQFEQQEAIEIIEQCRAMNTFGTTASTITQQHEHTWVPMNYPHGNSRRRRCLVCMKEEDQWPV